jgi:hypothetical protein
MRTDALDRLGTRIEKRFTKYEMRELMCDAGLIDVTFKAGGPYWTAVGFKSTFGGL